MFQLERAGDNLILNNVNKPASILQILIFIPIKLVKYKNNQFLTHIEVFILILRGYELIDIFQPLQKKNGNTSSAAEQKES